MTCLRKRACKVFTPEELFEIMPHLNGERADAVKFGKDNGINAQRVDTLRYLLGYSNECVGYKITKEQKDELIDNYVLDKLSVTKIAKKFSLSVSGVVFILEKANVYDGDPRKWTKIQKMKVKNFLKSGHSHSEIGKFLSKSTAAISSLIKRMKENGEL